MVSRKPACPEMTGNRSPEHAEKDVEVEPATTSVPDGVTVTPATSVVPVPPKRLPFFKVGKELKERVNTAWEKQQDAQAAAPAPQDPSR